MAAGAVLFVFYIKRLLPIVALPAEVTLGHLGHIHFVGTALFHLENLVMTAGALEPLAAHVFVMAEHNGKGSLGREGNVTTADFFSESAEGNKKTESEHEYSCGSFHDFSPLRILNLTSGHYSHSSAMVKHFLE
jgi:hypothetical protein